MKFGVFAAAAAARSRTLDAMRAFSSWDGLSVAPSGAAPPLAYYVACTTPPLQKFGNYLRSMKKSADRGADQLIDQLIAFGRNP